MKSKNMHTYIFAFWHTSVIMCLLGQPVLGMMDEHLIDEFYVVKSRHMSNIVLVWLYIVDVQSA